MGWSGATEIFDAVMDEVLWRIPDKDHAEVMGKIAKPLLDGDWDTESESKYWGKEMILALAAVSPWYYDPAHVKELLAELEED